MKNKELLIGWIVGKVDGEGNFSIEISKAPDKIQKEKVQLNFNITQHWVNESIQYLIQKDLKCGDVNWNNKIRYESWAQLS